MSLSSPRSVAQFFDAIKFSYPKPFAIVPSTDVARRDDGRTLQSASGHSYWRFSATVQENNHTIAMKYQALIQAVYFYGLQIRAYDFRRPYPLLDPTGSIIGANAVKINSIGGDNTSVSLKTLTNAYALSVGDYFEVTVAADGSTSLHQLVEDTTANGSGVTPVFQVVPDLPAGIAINDAVNLKKPCALFIITPGSFDEGDADLITTSGMTLEFEEA